MSAPPAIPGVYGKLPAAGDFVSRRLPPGFVRTWDAWIQEALTVSRNRLEAGWLEIYLTSPIWRFAMSPGNGSEQASAGILMPSVDKVGRYFPLTLAAMLESDTALPYLFIAAADWYDALERLALSALEDGVQLEAFDQALQSLPLDLPLPAADGHPPRTDPGTGGGGRPVRIEMQTLGQLPEALTELGACLLRRHFAPFSLWSTEGSDLLNPSLLAYPGLPPAADFCAFLTGDWKRFSGSGPVGVSPLLTPARPSTAAAPGPPADAAAGRALRWRSCGRTDVGRVREKNEDAFLDHPSSGIWAVADGMGGHRAGDVASRAIVDGLSAIDPGRPFDALMADVKASLQETNADLLRRSREDPDGRIMGSTVVVMLAVAGRCAVVWAGDSRLYRCRRERLVQLTRDHSPDAGTPDPGGTAPEEANRSNVVTRALGAEDELVVDTLGFDAAPGDTYLLCSDGLVKALTAPEIAAILSRPDPEAGAATLIERALARGARDNVTVVVVAAEADADPHSPTPS